MDEVSSTYTREEVAALVEESRGEGLLQHDEYDRLAGALGFTERTVAAVLMRPETLTTVSRDATVAEVEDVCAATGYSRFPVTGSEGGQGSLVGYLHIKDVLEPDEARRDRVDRAALDPAVRARAGERLPARRPRDPPAPRLPPGHRERRRRRASSGWPRSRTSSRSWSGEIRDAAHLDE